jgi:glycosyltransferase involved in cell wall biosynthesis
VSPAARTLPAAHEPGSLPAGRKIRILFLPPVDADNTNAQSLNTREIALRLDPDRFESTLWYEYSPDARLQDRPGIHLLRLPRRAKTLRILKEQLSGYDLVAYMDYSPASYGMVHLPRWLRKRTKAIFHGEAPQAQLVNPSAMLKRLYEGVLRRCDVYTGITPYVARDLGAASSRPVPYVLPVGVDCRFFTPPAKRQNPITTVLFVGTIIERKGPELVIQAAARFPAASFRIVGASRDAYDLVLKNKIEELGLNNVSLEDARLQGDVLKAMRESDIFILPSRLEGLPKVTLEAAATALPCIVFRDYETPSVIQGVTGFQVGTTDELWLRLGQLIQDSTLRETMGMAARKHAENFDWDRVSKQWEDAYYRIALQC